MAEPGMSGKEIVGTSTKGKKAKTTNHEKKAPLHALSKHHLGPLNINFLTDSRKRASAMSKRKPTLFAKAKELNVLCGADVKVEVTYKGTTDHYYSGEEIRTEVASGRSLPMAATHDDSGLDICPGSPSDLVVEEVELREEGTQCCLGYTEKEVAGVEGQCRVCGKDFDSDTRAAQALWIGCDEKDCRYWQHAACLLGKSKKITKKLVSTIPYLCPFHR